MEYVNGALKSNLSSPEMVIKPAYQEGFMEDLCYAVDDNVAENGTVSDDDFFVDELLDFSKAEGEEEEHVCTEEKATVEKSSSVVCLSPVKAENFGSFSKSVTESELCVPADELAHLEWLSNFVDDSAPGYSLTIPAEKLSLKTTGKLSDEENPGDEKSTVTAPVQTKARSKRGRSGVRIWPLSESSTSSSSSSHTTSSALSPWVMYNDIGHSAESLFGKPPAKKHKKQAAGDSSVGGAQPRRCSHCLVQKTPQWRAGPQGAKTLCNACGVRYKSGRLLPEYRPACSPTFSSEIHSNNHRKVLEMRRKKESDEGFGTPVESF